MQNSSHQSAGAAKATCAPGQVSAVYYAAYQTGDMIALELGETDRYVVVQFEDTMAPALVYVKQQRIIFPVPFPNTDKPEPTVSGLCGTHDVIQAHPS